MLNYTREEITHLSFLVWGSLIELRKKGITAMIHSNIPSQNEEQWYRLLRFDVICQSERPIVSGVEFILTNTGSVEHKPMIYDHLPPNVVTTIKEFLTEHFAHPSIKACNRTYLVKQELLQKTYKMQMNLTP